MPEPLRTPKQSRVAAKSRSHPYARTPNDHHTRDVGVERSSSLLGALKSIVTAPLAWFSSGDPQGSGDTHQKRRVSTMERGGTPPKAKRVRRDSPEVVEEVGYLDPPSSVFVPKGPPIPLWNVANGVPPARTMYLDLPHLSIEPADLPLPPSRGASIMTQASMSVEPQDTLHTHQSWTRDVSMPPPSPFARSFSRSGVTQLAAGATFGPSPKRRARESTAPPLLGSATPTPSFARPLPTNTGPQNLFPRGLPRGRSEGPMSTLLAQSRQSVSPMRESPMRSMSMLVSDEVPVFHSPSTLKTERTLSTLESFRTPLHGSLFPSTPLVETRRPRKVHVPIPSKLRFDHTSEGKKEKVRRAEVIGPYSSGMSGMRKLLARRREELEKEAEMDTEARGHDQGEPGAPNADLDVKETRKDQAVETDNVITSEPCQGRVHANGVSSNRDDILQSSSPARSKGDSYSTLRAPSSKVHRSHASAPKLRKSRNKFSLENEEEEEQEWSMSVEELKNYQARTQTHISFSTARRMSETGMQTDTSADDMSRNRAVSPVLPAQPQTFDSLLSRIGPSTGTTPKVVAEFPVEPPKTEFDAAVQIHSTSLSGSSTAPSTLPFSFGVSSALASMPKPADIISSPFAPPSTSSILPSASSTTPAPGGGDIPSFFGNTKAQFMPPKIPSGSLFGSPLPSDESEKVKEQPSSMNEATLPSNKEEKKQEKTPNEPKPFPFGGVSKPSVFSGSSASPFGNASFPNNASTTSTTEVSSPFGKIASGQVNGSAEESAAAFSFRAPDVIGNDTLPSINIFGTASRPAIGSFTTASDTSTKPAFSFNTPPSSSTLVPSVDKPKETALTAPSSDGASKPVFSFGASASSSAENPKSPFAFGASTQPKTSNAEAVKSPFSFGAAPSTPPPAEKKTGFTFGVTSSASAFSSESGVTQAAANTLTPAPPKPVFGGFGSVGTSAIPSTPKPPESTADNGDGMEVAGDGMEDSPTRSVEKKDTPAIQLPQSSPFGGFGSGGSSPGFSFGQNKAAPTESTFSLGQTKLTPANGFSFGQNANTSATFANTSTGFSFGANSTKPAGQSSSLFGAPLASAFGGTASNPTSSSSFSFSQSGTSTNVNPFGQSQQQQENSATTAPSSPSLFSQSTSQPQSPSPSFSFSLPTAAGSFGAAKPDTAASSSPTTQPFQFGASSSSQQPQQQAGSATANTMFTLGGAAATPPRKMKGLPSRRGKRP